MDPASLPSRWLSPSKSLHRLPCSSFGAPAAWPRPTPRTQGGPAATSSGPCWWGLENSLAELWALCSSGGWARSCQLRGPHPAASCGARAFYTPSCWSFVRTTRHRHQTDHVAGPFLLSPTPIFQRGGAGLPFTSLLREFPCTSLKKTLRPSRDR